MTSSLPGWLLWLPFAGAILSWLLPIRIVPYLALVTGLLTSAAAVGLAFELWQGGTFSYPLGDFAAPVGIELVIDGLSVWMLLLCALVNLMVGLYALAFMSGERRGFWPLWLLLWGGLNALTLSADLFNLYITLEVMSLTAIALVTLATETSAVTAALRYLLAAILGSFAYLLGVALIYAEHGTLSLPQLSQLDALTPLTGLALVLLTVGLLLKTAIFPFHFWLPQAHANAPAPVSALLSGLVVKASFYLLLRLWLFVFGGVDLTLASQLLGALGAAAVLYGSVQALRQERLKLLVAYSTVAQLGYLMLALPLVVGTAADVRALAYQGVAYHMMAHGLVKASLFLAAGSVLASYGHDRVRELSGMAVRLPVTTFVIGLAAASLVGLPPSGGFLAKWWLVSAALEGEQVGWGLAILLGGLLTALYMFRLLAIGLPRGSTAELPRPESLRLALPALSMVLIVVGIGLRSVELIELLQIGAPFDLFAQSPVDDTPIVEIPGGRGWSR